MDLGDKRRNKRAIQMLEGFSAMPTASIPKACGDWADTMGAYRFFENDAFEWADILHAHPKQHGPHGRAPRRAVHPRRRRTGLQLPASTGIGAAEPACEVE